MVRLEIDPGEYQSAGENLASGAELINSALTTLMSSLGGAGNMAGSDTGGQKFATSYDSAAKSSVSAGCTLGGAVGRMATMVNKASDNHATADAKSSRTAAVPPPTPASDLVAPAAQTPPSASGGTGQTPDWWHYVLEHVGGVLWPDADTGKLRSVQSAFTTAATTMQSAQSYIDTAKDQITTQKSPEVSAASNAIDKLSKAAADLNTHFTDLAKQCGDYAQHVDDAHAKTTSIMEKCLAGLAITAVVGIGLTLVTFGGSDAAAAGAASAEVAGAAVEVEGVLSTCAAAAETASAAVETVATGAEATEAALAPFEEAAAQSADATSVTADETAAGTPSSEAPDGDGRPLYRADSRAPEEIFDAGFQPKGDNTDLWQHVNQNPADSNFISTTWSADSAQAFADENYLDYIYQLRAEGIDVNALYGDASPFPWENEISVPGGIPGSQIEGAWGPDGWIPNPGYAR